MMGVTTDNREIELSQSTIDALKTRLRGPLLLPGDSGYERFPHGLERDDRPAARLVARCLGIADVVACVQFAREHGLLLCIKGGGHNIAGLAMADGAPDARHVAHARRVGETQEQIAHAQGGCLLGDVDRETQLHGLAAVLGFVSQTGIAGLTLGGGLRLPDPPLRLDLRQRARHGRRHRRRTAGARQQRGERRSLLGPARRRRQLRRGDRHRLPAVPGRAGDRRRPGRLAARARRPGCWSCTARWPSRLRRS